MTKDESGGAEFLIAPEIGSLWHEKAEKRWRRIVRIVAVYPSDIAVSTAVVDGKPWDGAKRVSMVNRKRFAKAFVLEPSHAD